MVFPKSPARFKRNKENEAVENSEGQRPHRAWRLSGDKYVASFQCGSNHCKCETNLLDNARKFTVIVFDSNLIKGT